MKTSLHQQSTSKLISGEKNQNRPNIKWALVYHLQRPFPQSVVQLFSHCWPFPTNPLLQLHSYEPSVLIHVAFSWHIFKRLPSGHSGNWNTVAIKGEIVTKPLLKFCSLGDTSCISHQTKIYQVIYGNFPVQGALNIMNMPTTKMTRKMIL